MSGKQVNVHIFLSCTVKVQALQT